MLGETELEDWDDEGRPLLLYSYPLIQNGSTIHLVVLTEGIHVRQYHNTYTPSKKCLHFDLERDDYVSYHYINIHDPKTFTLKQLGAIVSAGQPFNWTKESIEITDAPVSTAPRITDGCRLCVKTEGQKSFLELQY